MSHLQFVSQFKTLPDEIKPREKLAQYGPQSLALWELIALVLRTGVRHKGGHLEDVQQLAKRLLAEAGFKGLFTQKDRFDLQEHFHLYKSHSEVIIAVSEICRRLHGRYDTFDVSEPSKVFEKFQSLQKAKREQCFVLHVASGKKCVYQEMVAVGSHDGVSVSPSDILRTPLWFGAKEIMVVHNHPGCSEASSSDIAWTLALAKGAWELHHIRVLDHVIIGHDGYFSFLERGIV